jgi:hypothetical protein
MNIAINRVLDDAVLAAVDHLRPVADQAGLSMAELALAWVLRQEELAPAIEEALGDTPVRQPTLASLARPGVTHREADTP